MGNTSSGGTWVIGVHGGTNVPWHVTLGSAGAGHGSASWLYCFVIIKYKFKRTWKLEDRRGSNTSWISCENRRDMLSGLCPLLCFCIGYGVFYWVQVVRELVKLEIGGNSHFLDILCNSAQVLLDLLAGLCPLLDYYTGYCSSSQFVAHFFE